MPERKGLLVAVEGLDALGKSTQINLLTRSLIELYGQHALTYYKFPRYETQIGRLLRAYLDGELPMDSRTAAAMFALDRYHARDDIQAALEDNRLVLLDRYMPSQAFQIARFKIEQLFNTGVDPFSNTMDFTEWVFDLEFNRYQLPKPDVVIWFDGPPELSHALSSRRGEQDTHERDLDLQRATRHAYLQVCSRLEHRENAYIIRVPVAPDEATDPATMYDPQVIHAYTKACLEFLLQTNDYSFAR